MLQSISKPSFPPLHSAGSLWQWQECMWFFLSHMWHPVIKKTPKNRWQPHVAASCHIFTTSPLIAGFNILNEQTLSELLIVPFCSLSWCQILQLSHTSFGTTWTHTFYLSNPCQMRQLEFSCCHWYYNILDDPTKKCCFFFSFFFHQVRLYFDASQCWSAMAGCTVKWDALWSCHCG